MALIYSKLIVSEFQKALLYTNGHYVGTVGPGRYTLWHVFVKQSAVVFDMRKQSVSLIGQEILTKDHVPVRLTLIATYQVGNPIAAQHQVESWAQQIYLDLKELETLAEIAKSPGNTIVFAGGTDWRGIATSLARTQAMAPTRRLNNRHYVLERRGLSTCCNHDAPGWCYPPGALF